MFRVGFISATLIPEHLLHYLVSPVTSGLCLDYFNILKITESFEGAKLISRGSPQSSAYITCLLPATEIQAYYQIQGVKFKLHDRLSACLVVIKCGEGIGNTSHILFSASNIFLGFLVQALLGCVITVEWLLYPCYTA